MTDWIFIGVPYWLGDSRRHNGAVTMLEAAGLHHELGAEWVNVTVPRHDDEQAAVTAVNRQLAQLIADHADKTPLVIMGDCTASVGVVAGLQNADLHVLWYDAHGDLNTPETSPSQFLGGMPLAAVVGQGSQWMMQTTDAPTLDPRNITVTDGRDLDAGEVALIADRHIAHLTDVRHVDDLNWHDEPLYVHIDLDVLDTRDNPAVNYPADGGPSLAKLLASLKSVLRRHTPRAVSMTVWDNALPYADRSQASTMMVIREVTSLERDDAG